MYSQTELLTGDCQNYGFAGFVGGQESAQMLQDPSVPKWDRDGNLTLTLHDVIVKGH
jgi:hypothetical protein